MLLICLFFYLISQKKIITIQFYQWRSIAHENNVGMYKR